jgi:hypothetical protein
MVTGLLCESLSLADFCFQGKFYSFGRVRYERALGPQIAFMPC